MHEFAFILSGFAVGLIVGLTGVGGGSLMTPILIFFFGVKPHMAVGTDLLYAAITKSGGAWVSALTVRPNIGWSSPEQRWACWSPFHRYGESIRA